MNTKTRLGFTCVLFLAFLVSVLFLEAEPNTELAVAQVASGADHAAIQANYLYEYGTHAVSLGIAVVLAFLWAGPAYRLISPVIDTQDTKK